MSERAFLPLYDDDRDRTDSLSTLSFPRKTFADAVVILHNFKIFNRLGSNFVHNYDEALNHTSFSSANELSRM